MNIKTKIFWCPLSSWLISVIRTFSKTGLFWTPPIMDLGILAYRVRIVFLLCHTNKYMFSFPLCVVSLSNCQGLPSNTWHTSISIIAFHFILIIPSNGQRYPAFLSHDKVNPFLDNILMMSHFSIMVNTSPFLDSITLHFILIISSNR